MMNDNCIFCKLANGVFATNSIYEDENFNVILDVSPATKGHALILPKAHYADIHEMPSELLAEAIKVAQKVIKHATPILCCDGYNVLQNNGTAAGQTVFHYHMHLIPRYVSDENTALLSWTPSSVSDESLEALREQMKL
jgi:histidine triad (HIT) family protein